MKKIDWLIVVFFIVTSLFTLKDLFKPGFYTSHDGPHQIVRFYYFDQALRDGQIPPRWVNGLFYGFGYPLFIFSYHLPWFISEIFNFFNHSVFDSVKYTFLLGFILSGITMYFFQRRLFGRLAAFTGTFLFLYAPFRFSNIFVRAAIGDATILIFPSILFYLIYRISYEDIINWKLIIWGGIILSMMLLTHVMVYSFFFITFVIYALVIGLKLRRVKLWLASLLMILLSFCLSAYYLIPSLLEKQYTNFSKIFTNVYAGQYYINFKQLLYSSWGYGMADAREGAMSFQLGISQWLAVILAIILIVVYYWKKKKTAGIQKTYFAAYILIIFILSIFFMLPYSAPVWKMTNKLFVIDFPWRLLGLAVFSSAILGGYAVSRLGKIKYLAAMALILIAIFTNRNHLRTNQQLDWTVPFFLTLEKTTNSYDEYTPKWVRRDIVEINKPRVEYSGQKSKLELTSLKTNLIEFNLEADEPGTARINTFYYPGWQIYVNRKPVPIIRENGLLEFKLNKGQYQVKAIFEETNLRKAADFVSLLSLLACGGVLILSKKKLVF